MANTGVTASRIIGRAEELEEHSQAFYEELAGRFPDYREMFLAFAKQCTKNRVSLVRTYRETVSDALEMGFSFEGLDLDSYQTDTTLGESVAFADAVEKAVTLEKQATAFYESVAEHSRSLLATIPMAFKTAAKKRKQNWRKLQSLLE